MPAPIRVLLIQARRLPEIERQEQRCFLECGRLHPTQLRCVNVTRDMLRIELLDHIDAVLIGGSGEFSAVEQYPWTEALQHLLRAAADRKLPMFGSCWGHQMLAVTFGGQVVRDPAHAEFGVGEVHLTRAGHQDPVFGHLPSRFYVSMGHRDRVVTLPPGGIELARNTQPFQAFRLKDRPVYGTQFHSELNASRLRKRLQAYHNLYLDVLGAEGLRCAMQTETTPTVDNLIYHFLQTYATPC
ncbi:type 1 glutamine amidotransferase [Rhodothermus profundi]|uniref:GMP synthase (Glutamine-hydrolysing) n=1 Tax=Rhodothermus profundi TaxID=633813 RepID=A0A1M6P3P0_9BACT|nr:type 1 glutamine amidotransferase [Rhodothermus profundi]SHK02585.1 GMP synthase (glutamine-hydrolysing) [Rhodothermus profundi]